MTLELDLNAGLAAAKTILVADAQSTDQDSLGEIYATWLAVQADTSRFDDPMSVLTEGEDRLDGTTPSLPFITVYSFHDPGQRVTSNGGWRGTEGLQVAVNAPTRALAGQLLSRAINLIQGLVVVTSVGGSPWETGFELTTVVDFANQALSETEIYHRMVARFVQPEERQS